MATRIQQRRTKTNQSSAWLKNAGKSMAFSALNVIKEQAPFIGGTASNAVETAREMRRYAVNIKGTLKNQQTNFESNPAAKKAQGMINDAFEAIRTGNFAMQKKADDTFGMSDDLDFGFDFNEPSFDSSSGTIDFGASMEQSTRNASNISQAVLAGSASTIEGMSEMSSMLARTQIAASRASTESITNMQLFGINKITSDLSGIMSQLEAVNANLGQMIEFNNSVSETNQAMLQYFDVTTEILKDIQEANKKANGKDEVYGQKDRFGFLSSSGFDFRGYKDHIKKNFGNTTPGMALSMAQMMMGMGGMMDEKNLVQMGVEGIMKAMIPGGVKRGIKRLDDNAQGYMKALLYRLGDMRNSRNEFKSFLGELLGVERPTKKGLYLGNIHTGAMGWNGRSDKTLNEIIPSYLANIEAALTKKGARYYNFEDGTFYNERTIRDHYYKERKYLAGQGLGDAIETLNKILEENNFSDDKTKNIRSRTNSLLNGRINGTTSMDTYKNEMKSILDDLDGDSFRRVFNALEKGIEEATDKLNTFTDNIANDTASHSMYRQINNTDGKQAWKSKKAKNTSFDFFDDNYIYSGIGGVYVDPIVVEYNANRIAEDEIGGDPIYIQFAFDIRRNKFFEKYVRAARDNASTTDLDRMLRKEVKAQLKEYKKYITSRRARTNGNRGIIDDISEAFDRGIDRFDQAGFDIAYGKMGSGSTSSTSGTASSRSTGSSAARDIGSDNIALNEIERNFKKNTSKKAMGKSSADVDSDMALVTAALEKENKTQSLALSHGRGSKAATSRMTGETRDGGVPTFNSFMNSMKSFMYGMWGTGSTVISGIFGKNGLLRNFWDSEARKEITDKIKDELFNEETGVFREMTLSFKDAGNYLKYVISGKGYTDSKGNTYRDDSPDDPHSVFGYLKKGYEFTFGKTMTYLFGENYKENGVFQKWFGWMDTKTKREEREKAEEEARLAEEAAEAEKRHAESQASVNAITEAIENQTRLLAGGDSAKSQPQIGYTKNIAGLLTDGSEKKKKTESIYLPVVSDKGKTTVQKVDNASPEKVENQMLVNIANKSKQTLVEIDKSNNTLSTILTGDQKTSPKEKQKSFMDKFKAGLPKALTAALVGAGTVLASGGQMGLLGLFLPDSLIGGAVVGLGSYLVSQTETFKKIMFGEMQVDKDGNPTGERAGGLISKQLREKFKKALPAIVGGAAIGGLKNLIFGGGALAGTPLGVIGSALLPGNVLGGAILGMGIGLLKQSDTIKGFLFGKEEKDADGNPTGKKTGGILSKAINKSSKAMAKVLGVSKKAAAGFGIGALSSVALGEMGVVGAALSMGGPIGLGLAGAGIGIASSVGRFNEFMFGTKGVDKNGNPIRQKDGIIHKFANLITVNVVDPLRDSLKSNMRKFGHFLKNSIEFPFRKAFGPILDSLHDIKDDISVFVKKKFEDIGNEIMGIMKKTLGTIFSPITKIFKNLGKGAMGLVRGAAQATLMPLSLGLRGVSLLTSKTRRENTFAFAKSFIDRTRGGMDENGNPIDPNTQDVSIFRQGLNVLKAYRNKDFLYAAQEKWGKEHKPLGRNHLGWMDVGREKKVENEAFKKANAFDKTMAGAQGLREKFAKEFNYNPYIGLTDERLKYYQKKFTKKGIDIKDIDTEEKMKRFIFENGKWQKSVRQRMGLDTSSEGEDGMSGETKEQADARKHTTVYENTMQRYMEAVLAKLGIDAQKHAVGLDEARAKKKHDEKLKHLAIRLKKKGLNLSDLGLDDQLDDVSLDEALHVSGDAFDEFRNSREYLTGDFKGWYERNRSRFEINDPNSGHSEADIEYMADREKRESAARAEMEKAEEEKTRQAKFDSFYENPYTTGVDEEGNSITIDILEDIRDAVRDTAQNTAESAEADKINIEAQSEGKIDGIDVQNFTTSRSARENIPSSYLDTMHVTEKEYSDAIIDVAYKVKDDEKDEAEKQAKIDAEKEETAKAKKGKSGFLAGLFKKKDAEDAAKDADMESEEKSGGLFSKIFDSVFSVFGAVTSKLTDMFGNAPTFLKIAAGLGIASLFEKQIDGAIEVLGNWWNENSEAIISTVSGVLGTITTFIGENLPKMFSTLGSWITTYGPALFDGIVSVAGNVFSIFFDWLKSKLGLGWGKTGHDFESVEGAQAYATMTGQNYIDNSDGHLGDEYGAGYVAGANEYINDYGEIERQENSELLDASGRYARNMIYGLATNRKYGKTLAKTAIGAGKAVGKAGLWVGGKLVGLAGLPGKILVGGGKLVHKVGKDTVNVGKALINKVTTKTVEEATEATIDALATKSTKGLVEGIATRYATAGAANISDSVMRKTAYDTYKEVATRAASEAVLELGDDATEAAIKAATEKSVSKAISELTGESIETLTKEAMEKGAKEAAEAVAKNSDNIIVGFFKKLKSGMKGLKSNGVIKSLVDKFGNSKAWTHFTSVLDGLIDKGLKKLTSGVLEKIAPKFAAKITAALAESGTKTALGVATGGIVTAGFLIWDLGTGALEAAQLFSVNEEAVDGTMRFISSLFKAILGLGIGPIFDLGMEIIAAITGIDIKTYLASNVYKLISGEERDRALETAQAAFDLERQKYNAAKGTNLDAASYNRLKNKSVIEKIWDSITGKTEDFSKYETTSTERALMDAYSRAGVNYTINSGSIQVLRVQRAAGANANIGTGGRKSKYMAAGYGFSNIPALSQKDPAWANMAIGRFANGATSTMETGGCGPTALAMAANAVKTTQVSPAAVAKFASSRGYINDGGATAELFTKGAAEMGLTSKVVTKNALGRELQSGRPIVISGKDNTNSTPFTSAGHIVTATGTDGRGNAIINDPNTGATVTTPISSLKSKMTGSWQYGATNSGYGSGFISSTKKALGYGNAGVELPPQMKSDLAKYMKSKNLPSEIVQCKNIDQIKAWQAAFDEWASAQGITDASITNTTISAYNPENCIPVVQTTDMTDHGLKSYETLFREYLQKHAHIYYGQNSTASISRMLDIARAENNNSVLGLSKYLWHSADVEVYNQLLDSFNASQELQDEIDKHAADQKADAEAEKDEEQRQKNAITWGLDSTFPSYLNTLPFFPQKNGGWGDWENLSYKGSTIGEAGSEIAALSSFLAAVNGVYGYSPRYLHEWVMPEYAKNKSSSVDLTTFSATGGMNWDDIFTKNPKVKDTSDLGINISVVGSDFTTLEGLNYDSTNPIIGRGIVDLLNPVDFHGEPFKIHTMDTLMNLLQGGRPVLMRGLKYVSSPFGDSEYTKNDITDPASFAKSHPELVQSVVGVYANDSGVIINDPANTDMLETVIPLDTFKQMIGPTEDKHSILFPAWSWTKHSNNFIPITNENKETLDAIINESPAVASDTAAIDGELTGDEKPEGILAQIAWYVERLGAIGSGMLESVLGGKEYQRVLNDKGERLSYLNSLAGYTSTGNEELYTASGLSQSLTNWINNPSTFEDELIGKQLAMTGMLESGGDYTTVTPNDNGSYSMGLIGFHDVNAQTVLQKMASKLDSSQAKIANKFAEKYESVLTSSEASELKTFLTNNIAIAQWAQDETAKEIAKVTTKIPLQMYQDGLIHDARATLLGADILNTGPSFGKERMYDKYKMGTIAGFYDKSLDSFYRFLHDDSYWGTDPTVSTFKRGGRYVTNSEIWRGRLEDTYEIAKAWIPKHKPKFAYTHDMTAKTALGWGSAIADLMAEEGALTTSGDAFSQLGTRLNYAQLAAEADFASSLNGTTYEEELNKAIAQYKANGGINANTASISSSGGSEAESTVYGGYSTNADIRRIQEAVYNTIYSRKGKNSYSQTRRNEQGTGFSDCSSIVEFALRGGLGDIAKMGTTDSNGNYNASTSIVQWNHSLGQLVEGKGKNPNAAKLQVGDVLFYKNGSGSNAVDHVEMYVGNGKLMGHGAGTGPYEKTITQGGTRYIGAKRFVTNETAYNALQGIYYGNGDVSGSMAYLMSKGLYGDKEYELPLSAVGDWADGELANTAPPTNIANSDVRMTEKASITNIPKTNDIKDWFTKTLSSSAQTSYVTSDYGLRDSPFGNGSCTDHRGIDFSAAGGTAIATPVSGVVNDVGYDDGYGNKIVVLGNDGKYYMFCHMIKPSTLKAGDPVNQGDVVGYIGTTGMSTGNHLHFEVRGQRYDKYTSVDPSTLSINNPLGMGGESKYDTASKVKIRSYTETDDEYFSDSNDSNKESYYGDGERDDIKVKLDTALSTKGVERKMDAILDLMATWMEYDKQKDTQSKSYYGGTTNNTYIKKETPKPVVIQQTTSAQSQTMSPLRKIHENVAAGRR